MTNVHLPKSEPDVIRKSQAYFDAHRQELIERYNGQYVAIDNDAVIDHGEDYSSVAERVFAKLGVRPVFIRRVSLTDRPVHIVPKRVRRA